MKTCKKLFSLLLVAVMLVSVIPFASFADGEDTEDNNSVVAPVAEDAGTDEGAGTGEGAGTPQAATAGVTLTRLSVFVDGKSVKTETINYPVTPGGRTSGRLVWPAGQTESRARTLLQKANLEGTYGSGYEFVETVWDLDSKEGIVSLKTAGSGSGSGSGTTTPGGSTGSGSGTTTPGGSTGSGSGTTTPTPATPTETTYTTVTVNIDGKLYDSYSVNYKKAGELQNSDAPAILAATGKSFDLTKYSVKNVVANGTAITVDLETIPYAGWTLKVTDGSTTKTYTKDSYTGSLTNVSEIMTAFGATNDFTIANYETASVANNGKNFTVTLVTKPTANDIYTVNVAINGNQYASKNNVTYRGTFGSNATDAQAILSAAKIDGVTASNYEKITVTKSSNNVISIDLRNVVTIKVYNNASTFTNTEMEIGRPYVNYLGTNIINNSTFGGITVKDNSGASRFYTASQVNGGTAVVNANDVEVTIQRNGDSCTLYFLRSDGTVLESRKLYAGDQIGTLPSYTVGGVPATWTYNGKPISATDVYNFKTTSVNIQPYFGGISDVYVDVYTNGNVKTLQTRVKVTDLVQNGVLYLNSEVKSAISSALRNTSNKNLTYTAFFDASTWSDFIKTKNTNGAAEPIRVGDNSERQGSVYLYVMVNNVTQKATDSTNPKTGDDVKLGVAAAVLAVAVVGFGAAIVIKKKKGVQ